MPKYDIVEEACRHCWGKSFMNDFQSFFDRNAMLFADAPPRMPGEQDLAFHGLYLQYLQLFESSLSDYLATLNCSDEEFLQQLIAVQEDESCKDKKLKHFVNFLAASTDYASFYKAMVRAAKRQVKERGEDFRADEKPVSKDKSVGDDKEVTAQSDAKSSSRNEEKSHK